MRSFWSDPYLWIHLVGLATVPLWIDLCLLGLAMGVPALPVWLEIFLIAALGIGPVLWMQWQRPFYIFSVPGIILKPEHLTDEQRRLLTLFRSQRNRVAAIATAIALFFLLQWLYGAAAIAAETVSPTQGRFTGLLLAAISFLALNLFTQVPISVASVMLHSDEKLAATATYPLTQVRPAFSLLGLQVKQILPPLVKEPNSASTKKPPTPSQKPSRAAQVEPSATSQSRRAPEVSDTPLVPSSEEVDDLWAVVTAESDPTESDSTEGNPSTLSLGADLPAIEAPDPLLSVAETEQPLSGDDDLDK